MDCDTGLRTAWWQNDGSTAHAVEHQGQDYEFVWRKSGNGVHQLLLLWGGSAVFVVFVQRHNAGQA